MTTNEWKPLELRQLTVGGWFHTWKDNRYIKGYQGSGWNDCKVECWNETRHEGILIPNRTLIFPLSGQAEQITWPPPNYPEPYCLEVGKLGGLSEGTLQELHLQHLYTLGHLLSWTHNDLMVSLRFLHVGVHKETGSEFNATQVFKVLESYGLSPKEDNPMGN